jgi:hypothetical protein
MWALVSILFIVYHFISDPAHLWHGFLFEQLPNTQRKDLPFTTNSHTQNRNKENNLKLKKTPQNSIENKKKKKKETR